MSILIAVRLKPGRIVSVIRDSADCVVEQPVPREPVSASQLPDIREKYREIRDFDARDRAPCRITLAISAVYSKIP
jgi:hypothetical protein